MPTRPILHNSTVCDLAAEHLHLELLEARDRIADLESDITTYRELALVALENVAHLTARNKHLADRIDETTRQIRELLTAPCPDCRRAGRMERAA